MPLSLSFGVADQQYKDTISCNFNSLANLTNLFDVPFTSVKSVLIFLITPFTFTATSKSVNDAESL